MFTEINLVVSLSIMFVVAVATAVTIAITSTKRLFEAEETCKRLRQLLVEANDQLGQKQSAIASQDARLFEVQALADTYYDETLLLKKTAEALETARLGAAQVISELRANVQDLEDEIRRQNEDKPFPEISLASREPKKPKKAKKIKKAKK